MYRQKGLDAEVVIDVQVEGIGKGRRVDAVDDLGESGWDDVL